MTSPFMLDVSNMVDERIESAIFRAIVTEITPDSVRIKRVGAEVEDAQDYAAVDIYPFPSVDDEVLVLKLGKGYTVLGRIVRSGLDVLHNQLGDLEISGTLTLGPGGSITDADGSRWDQDGIVLNAPGSLGDMIRFTSDAFDHELRIKGFINATNVNMQLQAAYDPTLADSEANVIILATDLISSVTLRANSGIETCDLSVYRTGIMLGQGTFDDGSGKNVVFIPYTLDNPSTNPAGGFLIYADGAGTGNLLCRTPNGNVRTIALI